MTPSYENLILCAEKAPLSIAVYLQLWRHCYDENSDKIEFDKSEDDPEDWESFLHDLEVLEIWGLIKLEFLEGDAVEVTLPIRNGQKMPYLDN